MEKDFVKSVGKIVSAPALCKANFTPATGKLEGTNSQSKGIGTITTLTDKVCKYEVSGCTDTSENGEYPYSPLTTCKVASDCPEPSHTCTGGGSPTETKKCVGAISITSEDDTSTPNVKEYEFKNALEIISLKLTADEDPAEPPKGADKIRTFSVFYKKLGMGQLTELIPGQCVRKTGTVSAKTDGCYSHQCKIRYRLNDAGTAVLNCEALDCIEEGMYECSGGMVRNDKDTKCICPAHTPNWDGTQCINCANKKICKFKVTGCTDTTENKTYTISPKVSCTQDSNCTTGSHTCVGGGTASVTNNCESNPWWNGAECDECPPNLIFNPDNRKCEACKAPKPKPNRSINRCEACPSPTTRWDGDSCECPTATPWFDSGTCKTCPTPKTRWDGDSCECPTSTPWFDSGTCKPCPAPSTPWWDGDSCEPCPAPTTRWDGDSCECPTSTPWLDKGTCKPCPAPSTPWWDGDSCEPCPSNRIWNSSKRECVRRCPLGQTWNTTCNECVNCNRHQTYNESTCDCDCSDTATTANCSGNQVWNSSSCRCKCPSSYIFWNNICAASCREASWQGNAPVWSSSQKRCISCYESNRDTPKRNGSSCVACPPNKTYYDDSSKSCKASCPVVHSPVWSSSLKRCVSCKILDRSKPKWNGSSCVACPPNKPMARYKNIGGVWKWGCFSCPDYTYATENKLPVWDSNIKHCVNCYRKNPSTPYWNSSTRRCEACPSNKPYFWSWGHDGQVGHICVAHCYETPSSYTHMGRGALRPVWGSSQKRCLSCYQANSSKPHWNSITKSCEACPSSTPFYNQHYSSCVASCSGSYPVWSSSLKRCATCGEIHRNTSWDGYQCVSNRGS